MLCAASCAGRSTRNEDAPTIGGSGAGSDASALAGSLDGGAGADTSAGGAGGSNAGAPATVDANLAPIPLDAADCAERPANACVDIGTAYGSQVPFDPDSVLAACSEFGSYDGCGDLRFAFDGRGCATSVSPGARGWSRNQHLVPLRVCLAQVFVQERFPCLARATLEYQESCYVP